MRYQSLLAAAGLVATGLLVQQPAQAAPQQATATCTFLVPAKLVLRQPTQYVPFSLGGSCPKTMVSAAWSAVRDDGTSKLTVGCPWSNCGVDVESTPLGGTTHWTPVGYGEDAKGRKVADLLPAVSVTRAASIAQLTGVRSGTRTTLTASSSYYSPTRRTYLRAHSRMLVQYKDPGTTVWKNLTYVTPSSSGVATYTLITNRTRSYRVYVPSTNTVWYTYSPAVTR